MNYGLKGRKVLVVGASKGIGKEIAISFAREGAQVTTLARSVDLLSDLNKKLVAISALEHQYFGVDLMEVDLAEFTKSLIEDNGHFDIVIHNVGSSLVCRDPLASFSEWLYALKLNAGIAISMNHLLIPLMKKQKWGRIVHISSISAKLLRGNSLYASSKAFLNSYVTSVGRTVADSGIVMSAVMPGAVAFPGSYWDRCKRSNPEKYYGFLKEHQAINRYGTPEEIANLVLFLASNQATFMQASIVAADGASM